jgi:hypothetical protein
MSRTLLAFTLVLASYSVAHPQAQIRKLPQIINHPSLNLSAPFISADGNALLFVSDNGQDGAIVVSYTSRETDWSTPVDLPKPLSNRLHFLKGYALSADGKKIYVSSAKTPVVGGYDIFSAELKGSSWTQPENLMFPINSKSNEASPSFTPDGNTIYFMRCDKMDATSAQGCKIFKSTKKSNGQWDEPTELPEHINTGNSQVPRIMADGKTLIFSSDKIGSSKGGMDLYETKLSNGEWSQPVPLDFINSEKDDQYVTASALGRYLIKEEKGKRGNYELTEYLIPAQLRPQGLMKVEGTITDENSKPLAAYITLRDLNARKKAYEGRPLKDGSFFFYVPEGSRYELSVDPEQSHIGYFSRLLDLTGEKINQKERINVLLRPLQSGDELDLPLVSFKEYSSELNPESFEELQRLSRIMKASPDLQFTVEVALQGYLQDTTASDPDLTETSSELVKELPAVDSNTYVTSERTYFHNNRTEKQAEVLKSYLVQQGVSASQIEMKTNFSETTEGTRTTTVRVRVR